QYEHVLSIFDDVKLDYNFVISPGNHDHDFSSYVGEMRNILLDSILINNQKLDENINKSVTEGQKNYSYFERELTNINLISETLLAKKYKFNSCVSVQSLNTAWCSSINESSGSLKFPTEQIIKDIDDSKLKIVFFHHPFSWFEANNHKEIRNTLREISDVVITGHEHIADSFKVDYDTSSTLFIESYPLHDTSLPENGFISFYSDNDDIVINQYVWNGTDFQLKVEKRKSSIIDSSKSVSSHFNIKDDYLNFLRDIGTGFTHPDASELNIDNIFIYPNLRNMDDENVTVKRESSSDVLSRNHEGNVVFSGEEYVGKSILLKKLCLDILNESKFSVLINGSDIGKSNRFTLSKLEKIIIGKFDKFSLEKLSKISEQKVILIDDFDSISGDNKSIIKLVSELEKYFDRVIISVSDSYDLSENVIQGKVISKNSFTSYRILSLGHKSRWELIRKWNGLKTKCHESEKELIKSTDFAHKEINSIIGRNYIPSTPFFLLTMLQSMDSSTPADLNISSYGYYYQYLITTSLGVAKFKKEELDEVFNYISELANFYFITEKEEIDKDKLWNFNNKINKEYSLNIDCEKRLNSLSHAKILKHTDGYYSFRYSYVYYFFIAKYLSENIDEREVSEIIVKLIKNLHLRKNMNVLMFLTHHSKNKNILKQIVSQSKELFGNFVVADLDKNASFIDSLVANLDVEKLIYQQSDVEQNRLRLEDAKDLQDEQGDIEENLHDESENIKDENQSLSKMMDEFNLMFKSMELLGQLTKNYFGSLKSGPKEEIILEAMEAPLRALESIFSLFRDDSDALLESIESKFLREHPEKDIKTSDGKVIAKKLLYRVIQIISFQIIKKISSTIGSRNLLPVLRSLVEKDNTNAKKLIEISVLLDLGTLPPSNELKKIAQSLNVKSTSLQGSLLQILVIHYLYMFKESPDAAKSACSAVGINFKPISNTLDLENREKIINLKIK
ncbi:metallophosphoesterase, partial [Vibrio tarriae]|uniref:STAND family AAA ATPase n=2 Tax=Vibrio tarriae TaxID=2014742 RepID=UPI000E0757DC